MSLEERLLRDQIEATRSRNRFQLTVIRMLRAEPHNAVIAKTCPGLKVKLMEMPSAGRWNKFSNKPGRLAGFYFRGRGRVGQSF